MYKVRVLVKSYINDAIHAAGEILEVAELDGRVELVGPVKAEPRPSAVATKPKAVAKKAPAAPDFP